MDQRVKTALAVCWLGKLISKSKRKTYSFTGEEGTERILTAIVEILINVPNANVTATCFASFPGYLMMDAVYLGASLESMKGMSSVIAAIIHVMSVMMRVRTNAPAAAEVLLIPPKNVGNTDTASWIHLLYQWSIIIHLNFNFLKNCTVYIVYTKLFISILLLKPVLASFFIVLYAPRSWWVETCWLSEVFWAEFTGYSSRHCFFSPTAKRRAD